MSSRIVAGAALVFVLVLGIGLRYLHVSDEHQLTPNETAYLYYAGRIHDEGLGAWKALHSEFIHDPETWSVAPPVRIGYVILLDAAMTITGTKTVAAGTALSFLSSVLTLLIVAWMGLRFFNPWVSLIASALCATSFIEIWLVRGTPQDGVFGLSGLLAVWLACEIMRNPARPWLYLLFHIAGVWSVLSKQQGGFVYFFAAAWLFVFLFFHQRARRQAMLVAAGFVTGLAVAGCIFVALAGGFHSAWRAYELSFISNDKSWSYQEECCFGPWTQLPFALFLLSPLTCILSAAGIAALVVSRNRPGILTPLQRGCVAVCAIMAGGFTIMFSVVPKMQILRFVTPGDGAICIVGGVGLWCFMVFARRILSRVEYALLTVLVTAGFLGSMVRDYGAFDKVAMHAAIPELGAELIRSAMGR